MGIVVEFRPHAAGAKERNRVDMLSVGEIIIFPGVRIERYDLDLGHRVKNSAGSNDFSGPGPWPRPRKTS